MDVADTSNVGDTESTKEYVTVSVVSFPATSVTLNVYVLFEVISAVYFPAAASTTVVLCHVVSLASLYCTDLTPDVASLTVISGFSAVTHEESAPVGAETVIAGLTVSLFTISVVTADALPTRSYARSCTVCPLPSAKRSFVSEYGSSYFTLLPESGYLVHVFPPSRLYSR